MIVNELKSGTTLYCGVVWPQIQSPTASSQTEQPSSSWWHTEKKHTTLNNAMMAEKTKQLTLSMLASCAAMNVAVLGWIFALAWMLLCCSVADLLSWCVEAWGWQEGGQSCWENSLCHGKHFSCGKNWWTSDETVPCEDNRLKLVTNCCESKADLLANANPLKFLGKQSTSPHVPQLLNQDCAWFLVLPHVIPNVQASHQVSLAWLVKQNCGIVPLQLEVLHHRIPTNFQLAVKGMVSFLATLRVFEMKSNFVDQMCVTCSFLLRSYWPLPKHRNRDYNPFNFVKIVINAI